MSEPFEGVAVSLTEQRGEEFVSSHWVGISESAADQIKGLLGEADGETIVPADADVPGTVVMVNES